jgi:GcrA cell cycle regulator
MAQKERAKAKHLATCFEKRGFTDEPVLEMIHDGKTLEEICQHFQCNASLVRRTCARHGLPRLPAREKPTPWNEQTIAILREGWAAGKSTATIGRELGMNKNQIVGKAGRLDLPIRDNPIFPDAPDAPPRQRLRPTKVPKEPKPARDRKPKPLPPLPVEAPRRAPPKPRIVAPKPLPEIPIPSKRYGKVTECCWPIGESRKPGFRFCDAPSEPGRPYCFDHERQAREAA